MMNILFLAFSRDCLSIEPLITNLFSENSYKKWICNMEESNCNKSSNQKIMLWKA